MNDEMPFMYHNDVWITLEGSFNMKDLKEALSWALRLIDIEVIDDREILVEHILTEEMIMEGLRPIVFMKYVENISIIRSFDVFN